MKRDQIIQKVLFKLGTNLSTMAINKLIEYLKSGESSDFIIKKVKETIKQGRLDQTDIFDLFQRLIKKEKLHEQSTEHLKAFKQLLKDFPEAEITL